MRIKAGILFLVALGLVDCKKEAPPLETPRPAPVISSSVVNRPLVDAPRERRGPMSIIMREIPQGATIQIRNNEAISLQGAQPGQAFPGLVAADVLDTKGLVAFGFARLWAESQAASVAEWRRKGFMEVFHYGEGCQRRLGYRLLDIGGVTVKGRRYGIEGAKRGDASTKTLQIPLGTLLSFRLEAPAQIRQIE